MNKYVLIIDEIDTIMDPLKSELNIVTGIGTEYEDIDIILEVNKCNLWWFFI